LVREKEVKLKNLIISILQNQKYMLDKEDNLLNNITALEAFMLIDDELLINIITYDKVSIYMMCLALSISFLKEENLVT